MAESEEGIISQQVVCDDVCSLIHFAVTDDSNDSSEVSNASGLTAANTDDDGNVDGSECAEFLLRVSWMCCIRYR